MYFLRFFFPLPIVCFCDPFLPKSAFPCSAPSGPLSLSSGVHARRYLVCQSSQVELPNGYLSECNNINLLVVILRGKQKKKQPTKKLQSRELANMASAALTVTWGPFRCPRAGGSLRSASPPGPSRLRRGHGGPGQGQGRPTIAHLTPSPVSSLTARASGWQDQRRLHKRGFLTEPGLVVSSPPRAQPGLPRIRL